MNNASDFLLHIHYAVHNMIDQPELIDKTCETYEKIIDYLGILASEECDPDRFLQLHNDKIAYKILLEIAQEAKYRKENFGE